MFDILLYNVCLCQKVDIHCIEDAADKLHAKAVFCETVLFWNLMVNIYESKCDWLSKHNITWNCYIIKNKFKYEWSCYNYFWKTDWCIWPLRYNRTGTLWYFHIYIYIDIFIFYITRTETTLCESKVFWYCILLVIIDI